MQSTCWLPRALAQCKLRLWCGGTLEDAARENARARRRPNRNRAAQRWIPRALAQCKLRLWCGGSCARSRRRRGGKRGAFSAALQGSRAPILLDGGHSRKYRRVTVQLWHVLATQCSLHLRHPWRLPTSPRLVMPSPVASSCLELRRMPRPHLLRLAQHR